MKHPILFNIKEQFPTAVKKNGLPANCNYRIPYTQNKYWRNQSFRIAEQDYAGKDFYFSLIQINAKERLSFIISTTSSDLFWLYQLKGGISIQQYCNPTESNSFLNHLQEDEYALLYSPPLQYEITVEPGMHVLFLFVVNSTWLKRHPIVEPTNYQKLINYQQHKIDRYNNTKVLPIHDEIRREILHLFTMSDFGEILMDTKVNTRIVKLVLIGQEDLKKNRKPVSAEIRDVLVQIRSYYIQQASEGLAPSIAEVAEHFKISVRDVRDGHKAFYGHSIQSYITEHRMSTPQGY